MCKSPNTPTKNWSLVALLRNCVLGSCCRSCFKFDDTVNENDSVNGGAVDAAKSSSHADADEDRNIMKIRVLRCFLMNVDTRNGIFSTVSSMVCLSFSGYAKVFPKKGFLFAVNVCRWTTYLGTVLAEQIFTSMNVFLPRYVSASHSSSLFM